MPTGWADLWLSIYCSREDTRCGAWTGPQAVMRATQAHRRPSDAGGAPLCRGCGRGVRWGVWHARVRPAVRVEGVLTIGPCPFPSTQHLRCDAPLQPSNAAASALFLENCLEFFLKFFETFF